MSKLIVMLTYNDETVKNARRVFDDCKDLPVEFWGFKDIGLPKDEMKSLVKDMKKAAKTTFLEVVTLTEDMCLEGARIAYDCGFDYLMGTVYFDSVMAYCQDHHIKYLPFCGRVYGHPSILAGTPDEIAEDALKLQNAGCAGTDVLAYRHKENPVEVIRALLNKVDFPVCVAGSISTFDRIDLVQDLNPWTFTIGSALFEGKFGADKSFRGQLQAVIRHMDARHQST